MSKRIDQPVDRPGKETNFLDLSVEVDGKQSTLSAKLEFNNLKGLGKFTITVHSKHLSLDEGERDYLLDCLNVIAEASYDELVKRLDEYYRNQAGEDNGQTNMFAESEQEELDEKKKKRPKPTVAAVTASRATEK